jgi:hypothetical protein
MIGETQRMVARRSRDDPAPSLGPGELEQGITRPTFFEGTRALEIIELTKNLRAGELGQGDRGRAGGHQHAIGDAAGRRANGRKSNRHGASMVARANLKTRKRGDGAAKKRPR